jgi:hypothetical protein
MTIDLLIAIAHLCFAVGSGDGLSSIASPSSAQAQMLRCQKYYVGCLREGRPTKKDLSQCILEKP